MSWFNFGHDDEDENEEDKLFKNAGDFEMPANDYDFDELENKAFSPEFIEHAKKLDEEQEQNDHNKLQIILLYQMVDNINSLKMFLTGLGKFSSYENPFKPKKIELNKGVNMSAYLLIGFWKAGLIYNKEVNNYIENEFYKEHREFHKKLGLDEFKGFLTMCSVGIVRARQYYENNMKEIIDEHIKYFEKEMNEGRDIV